MESEFVFTPQKGEMKPLETKQITIQFYPQGCREVRTYFELLVGDGGESRFVSRVYVCTDAVSVSHICLCCIDAVSVSRARLYRCYLQHNFGYCIA